jgi:Domain of unknown function (DUF4286)
VGPIFMVQLNIAASEDERWNKWYNEVHLAEVTSLSDQIVRATRYRKFDGNAGFDYIAVYEFATKEALDAFIAHPELKRLGDEYVRVWGPYSNRARGFYEPIFELPLPPA